MLLAGEDKDDFGSRLRGGDESFKMGHARGGSAGGLGSYRDLSYPSPATPWDSGMGNLRSSMKALHHPTYRSDAIYELVTHGCMRKRDGEYVP
jgi:hypothetical protein